ncbi:hypothetical protein [Corynebacterium sp. sy039]|uniref:hypothetical protein n=1 Tax=Corynebacterium sp. sy039 TaxID=2599641 RepID=UPI0011B65ADD|nr:hypothetical protein [Corynebacterium sp. sy039]QDZ43190.1 hypothetical protein FQV43_08515 [Corynebacterium sp. sy039]
MNTPGTPSAPSAAASTAFSEALHPAPRLNYRQTLPDFFWYPVQPAHSFLTVPVVQKTFSDAGCPVDASLSPREFFAHIESTLRTPETPYGQTPVHTYALVTMYHQLIIDLVVFQNDEAVIKSHKNISNILRLAALCNFILGDSAARMTNHLYLGMLYHYNKLTDAAINEFRAATNCAALCSYDELNLAEYLLPDCSPQKREELVRELGNCSLVPVASVARRFAQISQNRQEAQQQAPAQTQQYTQQQAQPQQQAQAPAKPTPQHTHTTQQPKSATTHTAPESNAPQKTAQDVQNEQRLRAQALSEVIIDTQSISEAHKYTDELFEVLEGLDNDYAAELLTSTADTLGQQNNAEQLAVKVYDQLSQLYLHNRNPIAATAANYRAIMTLRSTNEKEHLREAFDRATKNETLAATTGDAESIIKAKILLALLYINAGQPKNAIGKLLEVTDNPAYQNLREKTDLIMLARAQCILAKAWAQWAATLNRDSQKDALHFSTQAFETANAIFQKVGQPDGVDVTRNLYNI